MLHYPSDEESTKIHYDDEAVSELFKIGFQQVNLYLRQYMDSILVAVKSQENL